MNFFDKKPGHQKPKPSGVTIIKKVIHSVTPKAQPPKPVASSSKRKLDIKPSATVKRSKPTPVSKPAPNVDPASDSSDSDDAFDPSSLFTDRGRPGTPPIADYVVPRSVVAKMEKKSWKTWDGFIHSADMMELERIGYVSFFRTAESSMKPVSINLEYPSGASERFLLVEPKTAQGEYHPVPEICRVVNTVLKHFIPLDEPESTVSSPSASKPPVVSSPLNPDASSSSPTPSQIIRLITRSTAPNVLSLPMFLQAVEQYNALLRQLRETGELRKVLEGMPGLSTDVWSLICEQGYQRVVGPRMEKLKDYVPFSSNTYGELLPPYLSQILRQTGLTSSSTFVDLGSGVANCVLQTALQVGCESFGCEQLDGPAELAKAQLEEFKRRVGMWGVSAGKAKVWKGDFCELTEIGEVLKRADLIVCNNYAFSSILNDRLSLLFLDLKEGARIVSLKPFVNPDFRLTERNCSSPQAILKVQEFRFPKHSVSWTDEGGRYYIHTVDRTPLQKYLH